MFELTIKTDNPEVLKAVALAVKNTPPVGYNEGKPTVVNVNASIKDMKDAKDNLDLATGATTKEDPLEDVPAAASKTEAETREDRRAELRGLINDVADKVTGGNVGEAVKLALEKADVGDAKSLPDAGNYDEVKAHLMELCA